MRQGVSEVEDASGCDDEESAIAKEGTALFVFTACGLNGASPVARKPDCRCCGNIKLFDQSWKVFLGNIDGSGSNLVFLQDCPPLCFNWPKNTHIKWLEHMCCIWGKQNR